MMRSVIWLFGQIKQFIRNCRRRCNCAEIDMRCYFNRSFPSFRRSHYTMPQCRAVSIAMYLTMGIKLLLSPAKFDLCIFPYDLFH